MGTGAQPVYWGSLIALFFSMIITGISILMYGLPPYVGNYPSEQKEVIFLSSMFLTFFYSIRYYLVMSYDRFSISGEHFAMLPPSLKKLIFSLLVFISVMCLVVAGAIASVRAELALFACGVMSCISFVAWFSCWILFCIERWPRLEGIRGFEEFILFFLAASVIVIIVADWDNNFSISLPIFCFIVIMVIWPSFVRFYYPALIRDISALRDALK